MSRALQFGKVAVCYAAVVALLAVAIAFGCAAHAERERAKLEVAAKGEIHALAAVAKSETHDTAVQARGVIAQFGPILSDAKRATASVARAAAKWEEASDAQIENLNKTGEDTRRTIAHFDRMLTNEVQPTLANLKTASAEVPAAITSITGTADAATGALNATKKPMEALDGLLRDQEHGVPKLIVEANGTLEETHATAGNFEVWSDKLTHPASVIKQWFYGLLDLAWKGKTLAK